MKFDITKEEAHKIWECWKIDNSELYHQLLYLGCDSCRTKEYLTIHHIDGDKRNNELSNLQTLCWSCHRIAHTKGSVQYKKKTYPELKVPDNRTLSSKEILELYRYDRKLKQWVRKK